MSAKDRTAALRSRRDQTGVAAPREARMPGRPADLVITADMIPSPLAVDAAGELSSTEVHDLGVCERAVDNVNTARWLAGKALQNIRDRKLYRRAHGTFEEYVQDRWEMSERAAYQMIEEWPLAEHLQQAMDRPATPSHTRALLPVAHRFGLSPAVELYQQLGPRAAADGLRLTAALTARVVQAVLAQTGAQAEAPQFQEAARQLMSAEALPALETGKGRTVTSQPPAPIPSANSSGPVRAETSATDTPTPPVGSDLQNFAEHHGEVTVVGDEGAPADASALGAGTLESLSPEDAIGCLRIILQKVRDVGNAIDSLVGVDPFLDGEAEELRQEIRRLLLRAAEPYRPYPPSERNGWSTPSP